MSGTFKIGDKTVVSHSDITDKTTLTADEANVGSNALVVDSSGNVGVGTTNPSGKINIKNTASSASELKEMARYENDFSGSTTNGSFGGYQSFYLRTGGGNYLETVRLSVIGQSSNRGDFIVSTNSGSSPWPLATRLTVHSTGVTVTGTISKTSGSFKIDHPLESKKETHHLVHSFVEAPQADNIYRGKVDLVTGLATINIDTVAGMSEGTFASLNREIQCFTSNETGWTAVRGSVTGNILTIEAQENTCTDTVSWLVIGERKDQHMYDTDWTDENGKVIVEPLKIAQETTVPD